MSGSKKALVHRADLPTPVTGGGGQPLVTDTAAPQLPRPVPPAPTALALVASGFERSGPSPSAFARVSWLPGRGTPPGATYELQRSTASTYTVSPVSKAISGTEGEHTGLRPATTYYFRVRAVSGGIAGAWSASLSVSIAAVSDAPPSAPTSLSGTWSPSTGNLTIRCTPPTGEQILGVQFRIYTASGGTLLRTTPVTQGEYLWTRDQQQSDRGGLTLPAAATCYIVANAVSWAGNLSTDVPLTATLSAPATVTGLTTSWAGDTGLAGPTCRISFTGTAATPFYELVVDGVTLPLITGGVSGTIAVDYDLARNAADHSGTPDPVLSISLRGRDALGQTSAAAATATATNAAPPATTLTAFGAFDKVAITITASTAPDVKDYRVRVYRNSSLVRTVFFVDLRPTYAIEDGNGSYTFDVAPRDVFGQVGTASAQTAAQELTDPEQFVAELRAQATYQDSVGTSPTALNGLKDRNLATNVVTYSASTPWRWTEQIRSLEVAHRKTVLATSASASYYYGVSDDDGATYTWYAGGTATGGVWSPVAQASEAAAQTAATTLAAGTWTIKLPAIVEGTRFRLGHRNTGASYALREFYPRSTVDVDDISVENLAGISADLGTVTAGTIIGAIINGAVITGGTVQTAASGARAELTSAGLKTYNAANQVVIEATTATDGALRAGQGAVTLDRDGITLETPTTFAIGDRRLINWAPAGVAPVASVGGVSNAAGTVVAARVRAQPISGNNATVVIEALDAAGSNPVALNLDAAAGTITSSLGNDWVIQGDVAIAFGLNLGGATGATAGSISALGALNIGDTTYAGDGVIAVKRAAATATDLSTILAVQQGYSGAAAAGFGAAITFFLKSTTTDERAAAQVRSEWTTATDASRKARLSLFAYDTSAREGIRIEASGSAAELGFFGASTVGKPTVTGSRGGNAALASVLTALANLGLITNSTTA